MRNGTLTTLMDCALFLVESAYPQETSLEAMQALKKG
jgi:hypothetical protein